MTIKTLAAGWEKMLTMIPATAPEIQRREMKRAFYIGASVMMDLQVSVSEDSVSEEEGVEILTNLGREILEFMKLVKEGKA